MSVTDADHSPAAEMAPDGAPNGAFDADHGPAPDLIDDCVHCGFCLPTCPSYAVWGEEMDSPRGRIQLMRLGHEQPLSPELVTHFDRCLGCMACVTACPSGVKYDELLLQTRPELERQFDRSPADRAFRRFVFELFPHPGRLRALLPMMMVSQRLGLRRLLPDRWSRLKSMATMAPSVSPRAAWRRLPEVIPAHGARRGTVVMLQGCVQQVFFSQVNRATAYVLAAEGFEVHAPREPACCGSLQLHTGYEKEAQACARQTIAAFGGYDTVVVNAAGCGSGMKDYGHLVDDPAFAAKVKDVNEFLAEVEPCARRHPLPLKVAYHDPCHLAHAQGIRAQPRELLRAIPDLELIEPDEWELCCGSAGIYNLLKPEAAGELGARKAANLERTNAQVIAAANPGCTLQIGRYLQRPIPILHPVELVAWSLHG